MKNVMEASSVSGSKGNEGDGTKSSEAHASRHKEEHKDTSEEALSSTLDTHLRKEHRKLLQKKKGPLVKDITRLFTKR